MRTQKWGANGKGRTKTILFNWLAGRPCKVVDARTNPFGKGPPRPISQQCFFGGSIIV
jgi:hypothetical protein